jgi:branched-chain amino acid transport system permease protein
MFPGLQLLIFAVIVIVVVELFPEGVAGWLRRRYKGTLIEKIIT